MRVRWRCARLVVWDVGEERRLAIMRQLPAAHMRGSRSSAIWRGKELSLTVHSEETAAGQTRHNTSRSSLDEGPW